MDNAKLCIDIEFSILTHPTDARRDSGVTNTGNILNVKRRFSVVNGTGFNGVEGGGGCVIGNPRSG